MTRWGILCVGLLAAACAGPARDLPPPVPEPPAGSVDQTLFLIGDAGKPAKGGDPVLIALAGMLQRTPAPATVVFLGDNLYPRGLPDSTSGERAEMERRLDAQIDVVLDTGARGVFIPGNHDWDRSGEHGWDSVQRAETYIEARGRGRTEQLPDTGCPGPVVVDLGETVRLVLLDTEWWLHPNERPEGPESGCMPATEAGVVDSLRAAVTGAGARRVIVAGHHPLDSNGPHGGHFTWKQHIFPLTELASWAWLPLPVIGSAYPIARSSGITDQDRSGSRYRAMVEELEGAFEGETEAPLAYAAGHEHVLEVLEGQAVDYVLVSGAGYYGHTSQVAWREHTHFAASRSGFMRIDALDDGRVRLGVFLVDERGGSREAYSRFLR